MRNYVLCAETQTMWTEAAVWDPLCVRHTQLRVKESLCKLLELTPCEGMCTHVCLNASTHTNVGSPSREGPAHNERKPDYLVESFWVVVCPPHAIRPSKVSRRRHGGPTLPGSIFLPGATFLLITEAPR